MGTGAIGLFALVFVTRTPLICDCQRAEWTSWLQRPTTGVAVYGDGVATMATLGVRSRSLTRSLALRFRLNHGP